MGGLALVLIPSVSQTAHAAEPVLRLGDTGPAVKTLETALKNLGLYHGPIDGIFGPGVKTAVLAFQSRHGLARDGVVGASTWRLLSSALERHPTASPSFHAEGLLREGDAGPLVTQLQQLLNAAGAGLTVDGVFGPATESAVVAFQKAHGIPASGVVGAVTMSALQQAGNPPVLQLGDQGPAVTVLQRELTALGYSTGGTDGVFGPDTQAAVEAFERAEGLPVDGVAGPVVDAALMRALETNRGMSANTSLAAAIVGFAQQYIGSAYSWGGTSPSTGFDCSGFVQYVFAHFGIDLPRTSYAQYEVGTHVTLDQLAPGDLVFFSTDGYGASHVGIYIGGGSFIASDNYSTGVHIDNINDSYWMSHFVGGTIPPGL